MKIKWNLIEFFMNHLILFTFENEYALTCDFRVHFYSLIDHISFVKVMLESDLILNGSKKMNDTGKCRSKYTCMCVMDPEDLEDAAHINKLATK